MGDRAITCTGLTRRFPSGTALDALTLDVRRGEVLALLGPNGAGKTTTMRLLNGVLHPDEGTATVLDLDPWTQGDELRARTGVLTENAGLDERFTAIENLELMARLRGIDATTAHRRAGELLERFGMSHRADVKVQGFSTGQRKRVALARALLHEPELLFLDEPTSGLDPAATRDVVDLIGSLAAEQGRTVVLCTHFLGEAGKLANRMAVLFTGTLHAFGTPAELAAQLWSSDEVHLDLGEA
ncbi:MAG: ABC transporter ATP-binding protein, partial [Actinobacteria bacterium]|nr:ABC transporter ATP-binding protein [Actinomycetota bacterium]